MQDKNGETYLFNLVEHNCLDELKQCVQHDQECIFITNNQGDNVLDIANIYGHQNIYEYLNPLFEIFQ